MKKRRLGRFVCLGIAVLLFSSCSSYVNQSVNIRRYLSQQDYADALKTVEKANTGSSKLVYLYEKGLILHYEGKFEASNEAFDEAELLLDNLYTRSLRREIGAFLTSDNVVEYRGERFESAFVNYYRILNYLYLGKNEDAAVECRKLNFKLQLFSDSGGPVYENDPFLQYFTGMVYESQGEYVDADVSYRAALEAYDSLAADFGICAPPALYCDLIRTSRYFGDFERARQYEESSAEDDCAVRKKSDGVLNLFLECGYVPAKREEIVSLPIFKGEFEKDRDKDKFAHVLASRYGHPVRRDVKVDYWLKVAVPSMLVPPQMERNVYVDVEGHSGKQIQMEKAEDLSILAQTAFDARKGKILLRATVRALAKYMATKEVKKKKGELAGWLTNAVGVATESADTRCWSTLPSRIYMGRLLLPEGTYDLDVRISGAPDGMENVVHIRNVTIRGRRPTFLNYRIY